MEGDIETDSDQQPLEKVKNRHIISVPFIQQCYSWDCGLACVSMILRMFGEPCDDVYTKDLDSLQCGESIWTIDLAYILNRHNVQSCLYTVTLGVNTDHFNKVFYKKHFSVDEVRVNDMFSKASQNGVLVQKRSLAMDELIRHLQENNPIISLVDWTLMNCLWCDSKVRKCWSCITCNQGPYQGHFVVVVGYDRHKDMIFYKNPDGRRHELCSIQTDRFQKARMSDGTDQDTLFVYNQKFKGCVSNCGDETTQVVTSEN
ncbi:hypothetical protein BsWGS_21640 [Bradybaena similaris]